MVVCAHSIETTFKWKGDSCSVSLSLNAAKFKKCSMTRVLAKGCCSEFPVTGPPPHTHTNTQNTEASKLPSTVNSKELLALKTSPPQTIPSITKGTSCFLCGTNLQYSPLPNLCLLPLAENSSTDLPHLLSAARLQVLFYPFLCRVTELPYACWFLWSNTAEHQEAAAHEPRNRVRSRVLEPGDLKS